MNTQKVSDELRTLEATEVDAVSGAATISMGLFGTLVIGGKKGCAIWKDEGNNPETQIKLCPK